jgi:hypothetical protein
MEPPVEPGGRRTLTAFFDRSSDAEEAIEALRKEGFAEADIRLLPGYERDPEGDPEARGHPGGFWASLADIFMPAEDRYSYAEGLSRGGYLVTVAATGASHDRALAILDREGTIDMDERETGWRAEGWRGYEGREPEFSRSALATGSLAGSTGVGATPVDPTDRTAANEAEAEQMRRDETLGRRRVRSFVEVSGSD